MKIIHVESGKTLYEGRFSTIRRCVEAAVLDRVDLSGADLRKANLRYAMLDGALMEGACLWGAQLSYADMSEGDFSGSDLRTACLKDICLAQSLLVRCDMRGSYMKGAIVTDSDFTGAQFSCPSMFAVRWSEARSLAGATYWHQGEKACAMNTAPVVVTGMAQDMVFLDRHILCDGVLSRSFLSRGGMKAAEIKG